MAAPPAATGTSARWIPRVPSARLSSQPATPTIAATYTRNVTLTVNSVTSARPPSPTPTAMATGRLRPVRPGRCAVTSGSLTSELLTSELLTSELLTSGSMPTSDLEKLGFLVLEQLVHLRDVALGQLIELALRAAAVVLARVAVLDQLLDRVLGVPPDVADRDPAVLRLVPGDLDEVTAGLLGPLREDDPDDGPVIGRVHAEVAVADGSLDRTERGLVEGLDHDHPGLRHVERGQLVHRRLRPVVLDRDFVEHRGMRAARADAAEILLGDRHGLVHLLLGLEERVVNHSDSRALCVVRRPAGRRYSTLASSHRWPSAAVPADQGADS